MSGVSSGGSQAPRQGQVSILEVIDFKQLSCFYELARVSDEVILSGAGGCRRESFLSGLSRPGPCTMVGVRPGIALLGWQLRVLRLGLPQQGDIWIGLFPQTEKVLIRVSSFGGFS